MQNLTGRLEEHRRVHFIHFTLSFMHPYHHSNSITPGTPAYLSRKRKEKEKKKAYHL